MGPRGCAAKQVVRANTRASEEYRCGGSLLYLYLYNTLYHIPVEHVVLHTAIEVLFCFLTCCRQLLRHRSPQHEPTVMSRTHTATTHTQEKHDG